jgi:deoxyhypusine synthase
MLIPNRNYVDFEEWINPLLDEMLVEQQQNDTNWTPSKVAAACLLLVVMSSNWAWCRAGLQRAFSLFLRTLHCVADWPAQDGVIILSCCMLHRCWSALVSA